MVMKFKFKNIMERGVKRYECVRFSGVVDWNDLPLEYLKNESGPTLVGHCNAYCTLVTEDRKWYTIKSGEKYTLDEVGHMMKNARLAGKRLATINKKIAESGKNWAGNEWEVTI